MAAKASIPVTSRIKDQRIWIDVDVGNDKVEEDLWPYLLMEIDKYCNIAPISRAKQIMKSNPKPARQLHFPQNFPRTELVRPIPTVGHQGQRLLASLIYVHGEVRFKKCPCCQQKVDWSKQPFDECITLVRIKGYTKGAPTGCANCVFGFRKCECWGDSPSLLRKLKTKGRRTQAQPSGVAAGSGSGDTGQSTNRKSH